MSEWERWVVNIIRSPVFDSPYGHGGKTMESSSQACPAPGSTGLLLEWAVESLKPGGGLGERPSKQAGMKNPPWGNRRWRQYRHWAGVLFLYGDQCCLSVPVTGVGGLRPSCQLCLLP